MRTLVVGCDASGKSTLLSDVAKNYNDIVVESTSTDESRKFKRANLDKPITEDFIEQRKKMYLSLTSDLLSDKEIWNKDFIGTDATLVTRLSHDVMRRCIGLEGNSNANIIDDWQKDEDAIDATLPDIIVFTKAPFETIRNRISLRQQSGLTEEKFWGFNSPFFLNSYQERWKTVISDLGAAGFSCLELDTVLSSRNESLNKYDKIRKIKS